MSKEVSCNLGFDGRIFLTKEEWQTYRRRKPVRYIRRSYAANCGVCGKNAFASNPLQHAHVISFDMWILLFGLTPEYLDADSNIVTAHRQGCNTKTELGYSAVLHLLFARGINALPDYLPKEIQEEYAALQTEKWEQD